jgi:hypothetical protein
MFAKNRSPFDYAQGRLSASLGMTNLGVVALIEVGWARGKSGCRAFRPRFRPMYPNFVPRGSTNIRECGFH